LIIGVGGRDVILPVSAAEVGSQSIPLNDEISFALPAVTVDDRDTLLSTVTGSDKVANIIGAGGVIRGAGAVDGLARDKVGRTGGSMMVMMDGDLDRLISPPGRRESPYAPPYVDDFGEGSLLGTSVVSDTKVTAETALADLS
jgi:hypothetical protein